MQRQKKSHLDSMTQNKLVFFLLLFLALNNSTQFCCLRRHGYACYKWNNACLISTTVMALNSSCEMSDTTDVVQGISASIDNLQNLKESDSNIERQRCLEDIQALFSKYKNIFISNDNLDSLLENLAKVLFEYLNDKTEKCRELSAKILGILIDSMSDIQFCLCYIATTFVQLLGKSDNRERSEEVRLLEVDILYKLIDKFDGNLLKYINDISDILCMCIIDEYPAVKRRSCECTSLLAVKHQSSFHMISSSVLKPLCHTISHQHLRTRAICVKTIGK